MVFNGIEQLDNSKFVSLANDIVLFIEEDNNGTIDFFFFFLWKYIKKNISVNIVLPPMGR